MQANPAATTLPRLHYRWVFAASLLLSAWLMWLDPLLNRDAIIYLRSADAYLQGGLLAAQQLHGRPILAVLMAWLHQLSGLSLMHSGLFITTLAYALLCTCFGEGCKSRVVIVHNQGTPGVINRQQPVPGDRDYR